MAAFHAEPQMHPGVANLDAVFANVDLGVRDLDLIEVFAGCCHNAPRRRSALQGLPVPLGAHRGGFISALQKIHQCGFGRIGDSHVVIHHQEFFHLRVVESCLWTDSLFRKTGRLGRSVGVKGWTRDVASAGPEPRTADFVRVSFACDRVGARALRSAPSGEARHRVIEASPEKVDWTGLAYETCPELLQDGINPNQDAPEPMYGLRVIRCVNQVLLEGDGICKLARPGPYLDIHAELSQCGHEALVKLSDALRLQGEGSLGTIAGL